MIRKTLTIAILAALAVVGAAIVAVQLFITGGVGFDAWVMRQVVGVAQTYLVPDIEFQDFDFQPPGTVVYKGVRFVAPDGTDVIEANELVVTLGERPRRGRPIVISGVTIRDGALRLVASPDDPDTVFKGLSPFVKRTNYQRQQDLPSEVRLSETLDLRRVSLRNAGIVYEPGEGKPVMRLDRLTMDMDIEPVSEEGEAVWHSLDINIDRGDILKLVVDGRVSLDELAASFETARLRVDVGADSVTALPPQLQEILSRYDASGHLDIEVSGTTAFRDWRASDIKGLINLEGFNVGLGEYRVPIDKGATTIELSGGKAQLGPLRIETHEGVLHALLDVDLNDEDMPADAEWTLEGLSLREFLRSSATEEEAPKIAGIVKSSGSATMRLARLPQTIEGVGRLEITDGRLINIPGVRELNDALDVAAVVRGQASLKDRFTAEFDLTPGGVKVNSSTLETQSIAARGTGTVSYLGNLDLTLNAGPLEKLQSMLGTIGEVIGSVTDRLVRYRVTGTVGKPKVAVHPLGIGS